MLHFHIGCEMIKFHSASSGHAMAPWMGNIWIPAPKVASTKDLLTPSPQPLPSPRFQHGIPKMAQKGVPVPKGLQNERHPNGPVKEAFGFEHRVLDQLVNKLVNQLVDQTG